MGQILHGSARTTAASLLKGGLNSKLHAVCDGLGRPIMMMLTEGQMSDHNGAFLLLSALPRAKELLADTEHRAVPGAREDAQAMTAIGSGQP
jgi:hypothetical protein